MSTFIAVRGLLELGSSAAFFTFLSQRQRTKRFVGWFMGWMLLQFFIAVLLIGILFPDSWLDLIWMGERRELILMSFIVVFLQTTLWSVIMQMGESQRLTKLVQSIALAATFLHLILMCIAWTFNYIEIRFIYIAMIIEWTIAIALASRYLRFPASRIDVDSFSAVFKEFRLYCLPLIPYSLLGFAYEFTDRWLLQSYGGSIQQAYYSIALQFSAISGIISSSIMNILWKEIAEAHQEGNKDRIAMIYKRVSRTLYLICASVAGFLVPWAEAILRLTLGADYVEGKVVLAIMLCYPILQSMGSISGTILYATGRVNAQSIIGVLFMFLSILVSYFVLVPNTAFIPGFGLGSLGLAIKMLIMAFIQVNITAFYLSRSMSIKFDWGYQPISCIVCFSAGWSVHALTILCLEGNGIPTIFQIIISGAMYFSTLALIIWGWPSFLDLTRSDILQMIRHIHQRVYFGGR